MRPGHKKVFRYVVSAAFAVSLVITACTTGHSQSTKPGKLDEFGDVNTDDVMAHLDRLAVELNSNPNLQGFIVGHNRGYSLPGWFLRQLYGYLDYLVNSRGIPDARVRVLEGDIRKEIGFELWLLPAGSEPPVPVSKSEPEPASPMQFDRVSLGNESKCVGELTIELYKLEDALKFFGGALHQQPAARAWVVVHPSVRGSSAKALETITSSRTLLTGRYGIESKRILTATGNPRSSICTEVNLWLAPSNSGKADEAGYYAQLVEEATQTEYNVHRVEFSGNQHIRDNTLRRRFVQQEGDVFSRKALELSLKNFSKLRTIYPVTFNDVEIRLDREEKLMDFTIYFRERPGRDPKTR
jgi:hypothetical protein